jgi:hypothetical protein
MKQAKTIHHYIWLINKLRHHEHMTLGKINELWVEEKIANGNPIDRTSFYRYKDAIFEMFGILIECDKKHRYRYFISNPEAINDKSLGGWILSTMTVGAALSDCTSIRNRIILESAPRGEEFLQPIISAMKNNHRLRMRYQKFETDVYEKTICPYVLKRHQQRWYLLALNDENEMRTYALDSRMIMIKQTDETFEMPTDFSPASYFAEYFGVLTDDTPITRVVVRAYDYTPNDLRSLPLHHSQRELQSGEHYTDFSFDIRPTNDFLRKLLQKGSGIEVLEPADVRQRTKEMITEMLKRY